MNENSKTLPNMSLTAFKALVGQQPVYVELVERYGARGDKIPEKLRGKRRIVKARSYGFDIAIAGSLYETSRLDIRRASYTPRTTRRAFAMSASPAIRFSNTALSSPELNPRLSERRGIRYDDHYQVELHQLQAV